MARYKEVRLAALLTLALPLWNCSLAQTPPPDAAAPASEMAAPEADDSHLLIDQFGLFDFGVWTHSDDLTAYPEDWRKPHLDYARAAIDLALNQNTDARKNIEAAIAANPTADYLYTRLAMSWYMDNQSDKALAALESGLRQSPQSLDILTLKARLLEDQRKVNDAITVYEDILTSHPNHLDSLSNLAESYFRTNQKRERTKDLCRHILEIDGRHYMALILLGTMETIDGNMDAAAGYLERAIRRRRWEPWRVLNIARIMERNRRPAEATRIYSLLMEYYPDNEEIRKRWEEMIVQQSGEEGLISAFEELIKKNPASEALYTVYAQFLISNGRYDKALEIYKQLQIIQPDNLYVNLLGGFEALKLGDLESAQHNFEEYLTSGGEENSSTPYIQVAMFYSQFGHDAKAMETIENALALFKEADPPLLLTLAEMKEKSKDFAAAEQIYQQLIQASPTIAAYHAMLGQCYQLQGKLPEALKAFVEAQTKAMPSPRYLMDAALLALELGLTDQAGALIQTVMDAQQDDESQLRVALMAASAYDQYGLNDETEKWAGKAQEIIPNNLAAQSLILFARAKRERNFDSLKTYPEFIAQIKDKSAALPHQLNLARLLLIANQPGEAVDVLKALQQDGIGKELIAPQLALALAAAGRDKDALETIEWLNSPKDGNDYLTAKADVFKQLKKYQDAEELLTKLLTNNSMALEPYVQLGALYQDMGAWEEAEDIYTRGLSLFPFDHNLLNNYGYMLAMRGVRLDEAEEMINFALRLNPGAGYILDSLAWVEYKRGFYDKAMQLLESAWVRSVPEAEIAIHMAETCIMLNQADKAREFYEKALMLEPDNAAAKEGLKKVK